MPMLGPMTRKLNRKRRVKTSAQFVNVSFIDVDCSLAKTSSVVSCSGWAIEFLGMKVNSN